MTAGMHLAVGWCGRETRDPCIRSHICCFFGFILFYTSFFIEKNVVTLQTSSNNPPHLSAFQYQQGGSCFRHKMRTAASHGLSAVDADDRHAKASVSCILVPRRRSCVLRPDIVKAATGRSLLGRQASHGPQVTLAAFVPTRVRTDRMLQTLIC